MTLISDTAQANRVLACVDNPANENRWGDAKGIADRLGWPRRGMTATLEHYERRGMIESKRPAYTPSPRSDAPPRLWRVRREDGTV